MIGLYLRIFLYTGGLFALLDFAANQALAPGSGPLASAIKGLAFGCVMSALLGTIHALKVRALAGGEREGDIYATRQTREVETGLAPDRAFALLSHYLKDVRKFRVIELNQEAGRIQAGTPWTIRAFGCRVLVEILKRENGAALVRITSKPALPLTLADYGENFSIASETAAFLRGSGQA